MREVLISGRSSAARAQVLLTGLAFGESPRWRDNRLWLSNWGGQEIIALDLGGRSEVVLRAPTTIPFCFDWLPDDRMLIVSGREGLLLSREPGGTLTTYADLRGLSDRPWNEIVVDGRANTYVNVGGFDRMAGEAFAPGIIALVGPGGSVRQVADGIAFPNGMAVTLDNATLIVAESYGRRLSAFDIAPDDGGLSNRRVWANLGEGCPDGVCLDAEGAVWYADVPNKRCVRVREGGEVLKSIDFDHGCFACMLGGPGRRTLFVLTAEWRGPAAMADAARTGQVLAVKAPAPGVGGP
jgi:sugar lactone lactonase YvrE